MAKNLNKLNSSLLIQAPNIFEYHSYIEFLKDHIAYLKQVKSEFSLRKLSVKLNLAIGFLPMVLSGKRKMTNEVFTQLLSSLELTAGEQKYLALLRSVSESHESSMRANALSQLQKFNTYKNINKNESVVNRYLSKWYYIAIRELVNINGFRDDIEWIQSRLVSKVPKNDIKSAWTFLIDEGFVAKDSSGRFYLPKKELKCEDSVFKISLGEFHRQILNKAYESIENTSRDQRYLKGHTLAITKNNFDKIKKLMDDLIEQVNQFETNEGDEIYHLELAMFPLSRGA